ncbi:hypothetical protein MMC34_002326 [Xylographa carneopallida]|nr:hypothetical protein [Xylographa carneopallida]
MDRINENHCAGLTDGAILRGVIATDMEIEFLQQFYGINFTEVLTYGVPWISAVHMLESLKYVTKSPVSYHLSYFASYHHAAVNDEKVRGMFLKELAVSAANCINHAAPRWSVQEIYETIRYDIFTWKGKTSGDFFWRVSINFLYAEKIAKWQQKAGQELALRQIEDDEFEKQRDLTRIGGEGASTCTMELVNRIPERVWPSIQACRRFIGKNFRTDFWGTTMSAPIIQRKQ